MTKVQEAIATLDRIASEGRDHDAKEDIASGLGPGAGYSSLAAAISRLKGR
jgi:hypothetical protein